MKAPTTRIEMVWEDPPATRMGRPRWAAELADELEELRKHPKRWAQLRVFEAGSARKSHASVVAGLLRKKVTGFEFRGCTLPDGTQALYGSYVGGYVGNEAAS